MGASKQGNGNSNGEAEGGPPPTPEAAKATPAVNAWQFLTAFIVVLGLVVIVLIVVKNVKGDNDSVVGVLGVIVPAFATIGAAVFGVASVYRAAKASGEEAGEAKGAAGKDKAVGNAKKDLARELLPDVRAATERQHGVANALWTAGSSESGRNLLNFDKTLAEGFTIERDDLQEPALALERVRAKCEHILGNE